uniref:Ribonuclease H-like domain-containing protein n=1 Tax=Tanacetum cinerariifolium TaxID=118510 RepID=A0A6L2JJ77_TANCI|nr:ribonuclease H-like domain-containing protein [Tanacetum cinerariifolium]
MMVSCRGGYGFWRAAVAVVAGLLGSGSKTQGDLPLAGDYHTQKLLLRCDSMGDLYPVTQQPLLQTLVVLLSLSSTTCHRCLGNLEEDVLRRLESTSNNIIIPRHVRFDEDIFLFGNFTNSTKPNYDFLLPPMQTRTNVPTTQPFAQHVDEPHSPITAHPITSPTSPPQPHTPPSHSSTPIPTSAQTQSHAQTARLVANRRSQQQGIDCDETFSAATIRTVLSLAVSRDWTIHQLDVKNAFLCEFAMKDLGSLNYFLGISAQRSASGLFLSQLKFVEKILERAHMQNCNLCRTLVNTESKLGSDGEPVSDPTLYHSLAGALQYLTFTRPNLSYAVQQVCLYMHDPRDPHFTALKHILCYVRGTLDYSLQLHVSYTTHITAYTNADWAGCHVTRRSTSIAEAEYRGVANVVAETAWIRYLLRELHTLLFTATLVYCDNVSAVYMSANPVQHQRTKHIEVDIHFVHDFVALGQVRVLHVPSRFQYADIFTKGLPSALFLEFRTSLNVRRPIAHTVGEYWPVRFQKEKERYVISLAFLVPGGLYEWLVMPFGLKNAPSIFQRKMDKCFKGTESFIAVYIDDILVFSKNEKEHANHLEKLLKICEDNGLVLSPTKMKIAVSTIDFLVALIGEGTIKLQPHIIKKIVNFNDEELKTKKGLRSFLETLNYVRNHISKLGILLRPLYEKTNAHEDKRLKPSYYELTLFRADNKSISNLVKGVFDVVTYFT